MLKSRVYHSPDGKLEATPERVKHWSETFKRFTDAGNIVPMHFDHSNIYDELLPVTLSEYQNKERTAANSVGRMVDIRLHPSGDGAEIVYEVDDPKAIEIVSKNNAQLSPVIFPNWKDGKGNEYKDLFTHLDIVNHAVDSDQTPSVPVCCSVIRMGNTTGSITAYRLGSENSDEEDDDDLMKSALEGEESLTEEPLTEGTEGDDAPGDDLANVALDGADADPMADPMADDDGIADVALDGADEADSMVDGDGTDSVTDPEIPPNGIGELMVALKSHDINLPDDTNDSNFFDRLKTALIATADTSGSDLTEFEVSQPQQGFMAMSVEQYANKTYRTELARQLNGLLKTGRATPNEIRKQVETLKVVKLSLNKTGDPVENQVSQFIENRKSLPAGAVWSPKERLSRMSAMPQPEHATTKNGELTGKALEDAVNSLVR